MNSDKVVPIEMTMLNEYNLKTGNNIENVKIHYGAYSYDLTRAYHATALTIGSTIYFTTKVYKPETEEGRKLLAHELTHVAQNKNKQELRNTTRSELEEQAEQNEEQAVYNPDPNVTIKYHGKYITMRESQMGRFADKIAKKILEEVGGMEKVMSDADYLKYLIDFSEKMKSGGEAWLN